MAGERTLPGIGLTGFWDLGSAYKDDMDANLRLLSALTQGAVIDAAASAPGSPSNGDIYLASAEWTGIALENDIVIRDNGEWVTVTPLEGWLLYDRTANTLKLFDGSAWVVFTSGGGGGGYDIRFGFSSTPTSGQVIDTIMIVREITFPADFAGSLGLAGTNPTASFSLSVKDGGVEIGTVMIGTGGSFTFATTGGVERVVVAGSVLTIEAPGTVDATVADVTATLLGEV